MTDQANLPATTETGSLAPSTTSWPAMQTLDALPKRLDDDQFAMVEAVSRQKLPALPLADDEHIAYCLKALDANLPRKQTDEDTGALRARTFRKKLEGQPKAAINWALNHIIENHQWYPTVKELLDVLKRWRRQDEPALIRSKAYCLYLREKEARENDEPAERCSPEDADRILTELAERFPSQRDRLTPDCQQGEAA